MGGSSKLTTMAGLAFLVTLVVVLPQVSAKRFIVGGNMGWRPNVNYSIWAGNQTFYFGDWLFFVYDRNQNDVLEVNKTNYETCNGENPVHNHTTGAGRDVVPLNVTHDRYFISSKGYCYGGMKLHVHLSLLPPPSRAAAPAKSDSPRPTVNLAPFPSPLAAPAPAKSDSPRSTVNLAPFPLPPLAAPAPAMSDSPRLNVFRSQLMIPAIFTIAVIWGSLLRI